MPRTCILIPGYTGHTPAALRRDLSAIAPNATYHQALGRNSFVITATDADITTIQSARPDWFIGPADIDEKLGPETIDNIARMEIRQLHFARAARPAPIKGADATRYVIHKLDTPHADTRADIGEIESVIESTPGLRLYKPLSSGLCTVFFDCAKRKQALYINPHLPPGWKVHTVMAPSITMLLHRTLGRYG